MFLYKKNIIKVKPSSFKLKKNILGLKVTIGM